MKAYCAQPNITKQNGEWKSTIGIPTFYLFRSVQGIVSQEQAEQLVTKIVNPTNDPSIIVHPNVTLVDVITSFEE
jgi:hypothetical protein